MTDRDVERELEENAERAAEHDPHHPHDTSIPGLIESAAEMLVDVFMNDRDSEESVEKPDDAEDRRPRRE